MKLLFLVVLLGVSNIAFANDDTFYERGQTLSQVWKPSAPSDASIIPEYQGREVSQSNYLENFHKMSEDASALLQSRETSSDDSRIQAAQILRENIKEKPHFKFDPKNDPLITHANKIIADPASLMEAEIEEEEEQEVLEKTQHTCLEGGDPYQATCSRTLVVYVTPQYQKRYVSSYYYRDAGGHKTAYSFTDPNSQEYSRCWWWDNINQAIEYVSNTYAYEKKFCTKSKGGDVLCSDWVKTSKEDYDQNKDKYPEIKEDQWFLNCDSLEELVDQGHCSFTKSECVEGEETRNIEGMAVKRDCWKEKITYTCDSPSQNTCNELRYQGCRQIGSVCKKKHVDVCVQYEQTFECSSLKGVGKKIKIKGKVPYCMDGNCSSHLYVPNKDFNEALTKLSIFQAIQKDMDTDNLSVFKGQSHACTRNCVNFRDCCAKGEGWGVSLRLASCSEEEKALAKMRSENKCVYVGTYCAEKVLGVCIRKKSSYCCFSSKLSRLLHEQGRSQLGLNFGSAESPLCRGFTIDELQSLDFDQLNLSELYSDLQAKTVVPDMGKFTKEMTETWKLKIALEEEKNFKKKEEWASENKSEDTSLEVTNETVF